MLAPLPAEASAKGIRCTCAGVFYSPSLHLHHINTKELAAVVMSALRWCHLWAGHHVIVHTDSAVTQGVINKGSARNTTCLHLLQLHLLWTMDLLYRLSIYRATIMCWLTLSHVYMNPVAFTGYAPCSISLLIPHTSVPTCR